MHTLTLDSGHPASMGPGSFDPGNQSQPDFDDEDIFASMGPGSFDPGNQSQPDFDDEDIFASMGPGSFDPGNGGR